MRDAALSPRPVLNGRPPQRFGDLVIESRPETTILQLLGQPGTMRQADLAMQLDASYAAALRPSGLGQWFLVLDRRAEPAEIDRIAADLGTQVMVIDQSHGRSRIALVGRSAPQLLAKGTSIDLDITPVGTSTATLFGHIGVHLSRTADDTYELLVLRGFAESLWDELCLLARSLPGVAA